MKKYLILMILLTITQVNAEYGSITQNFTFATAIYPEEHLKGGAYQIIFVTEYTIQSNLHSEDISLGTNYQNATHRFFDYMIFEGSSGGFKTFSWNVIDEDEDIIEICYIDIHVLLDRYDETYIQSQLDNKDKQIADLYEDLGKAQDQNETIIYRDRTPMQMIADEVSAPTNAIIFFLFLGSLVSIPSTIQAMRKHRLDATLDITRNAVRVKYGWWEVTFEVIHKISVFKQEGYKAAELEIDQLFQKEWVVFGSQFSPYPADWLTCLSKEIKESPEFKGKGKMFLDMSIGERIDRIRTWDRLSPISERYDLWAQFIRFALIPCCTLYPEFWEDDIAPLVEKYTEYSEKARERRDGVTTNIKGKTHSDKPPLITSVSDELREGGYGI